jgi:hypothetical protein
MRTSILVLLVLGTFLFVTYVSHPLSRRILFEGFDALPNFSLPAQDLSKNADFMTFLQFHQQVCAMWNETVDDIMKNDQVDKTPDQRLSKEQYIRQMETTSIPPTTFIRCQPFDQTSTLEVLLASIPENTKVYKNTFKFLDVKMSESLQKLKDALNGSNVSVSAFEDCKEACAAQVATATANAVAKAKPSPSVQDLLLQQQRLTTTVLTRVKTILVELPSLQASLKKVTELYNTLKEYKAKGESGAIYSEVQM